MVPKETGTKVAVGTPSDHRAGWDTQGHHRWVICDYVVRGVEKHDERCRKRRLVSLLSEKEGLT